MTRFGFHPEARSEFRESARYYEEQQAGLGFRYVEVVRAAIARIQLRPRLYREIDPGVRQCMTSRFPYGIIYRIQDDELQIVAVMHLHRQPGYWRNRL
jgi:toxin ParE1/3/4